MPSYHLVYIVILPSFQLLYYLPRHQVHPLPKVLHLPHQAHRSHLPVCNQLLWALLSAVPILARMEERVLYQATFACVQNITCGTCALFMLVSEWVGAWVVGWHGPIVANTVFCSGKADFSRIFTLFNFKFNLSYYFRGNLTI